MKFAGILVLAGMIASGTTAGSAANPPLRDVAEIDTGLFVIGLADQIRKNCPAISARLLKALGAASDLQRKARSFGYSDEEINRHLKSDVEKDRLRAQAAAYLAERDVTADQEGYCALGRAEIARNSAIGALLREKN